MSSLVAAAVLLLSVMSLVQNAPSGWSPQGTSGSPQGWYQGPLAMPEVLSDGTLAETPEVAAARAANLAALQAAVVANPDNDDGHYDPHKYGDHLYGVVSHAEDLTNSIAHYNTLARSQAQASAQAESDIAVWKTKEATDVAAGDYTYGAQNKPYCGPQAQGSAQAEADLALWKTKEAATVAAGGYSYGAQNKPYSGPQAQASAQAEADLALWKAKEAPTVAAGGYSYGAQNKPYSGPQAQGSAQAEADLALWKTKEAATVAAGGYSYGAQNKPYSGPQAQASAQAEADLALWKAKEAPTVAAGGYSYGAQNKPYSGPLAMLEVLPSGYLADTLEVAAARRTHLSALAEAQAAETLWRAKHSLAETQHRPWN